MGLTAHWLLLGRMLWNNVAFHIQDRVHWQGLSTDRITSSESYFPSWILYVSIRLSCRIDYELLGRLGWSSDLIQLSTHRSSSCRAVLVAQKGRVEGVKMSIEDWKLQSMMSVIARVDPRFVWLHTWFRGLGGMINANSLPSPPINRKWRLFLSRWELMSLLRISSSLCKL